VIAEDVVASDPTSIYVALITLGGTIGGIVFTWWKFRKSQTSTDHNLGYDQLQEDLTNERAARQTNEAGLRADIASLRAEVAALGVAVRVRDDYIGVLRQAIYSQYPPPPPPWPVALTKEGH
jgi:hypothetical protein